MSVTTEDALRLQRCLEGDGVAIVPTDTVYGLACNPESEHAVQRLYELKRRARNKPSATMFFALGPALDALPELEPRMRKALRKLLPGPVTLLLRSPRGETRGLRVPLFDGALASLASVRASALQSSANLSGGPDPRRIEEVPTELRDGADLVLDGGELPGTASTVIDLTDYEQTGAWRIVREGALGRGDVERKL